MKKFRFSMETVKLYKEKLLDNLKAEYAQAVFAVREKEQEIQTLEQKEKQLQNELNQKNAEGISPSEIGNYKRYLNVQHYKIQGEYKKLESLSAVAEQKKDEVVEMRKETLSFEKLKEKKLQEYNALAAKKEEQFIEEFISNKLHQ